MGRLIGSDIHNYSNAVQSETFSVSRSSKITELELIIVEGESAMSAIPKYSIGMMYIDWVSLASITIGLNYMRNYIRFRWIFEKVLIKINIKDIMRCNIYLRKKMIINNMHNPRSSMILAHNGIVYGAYNALNDVILNNPDRHSHNVIELDRIRRSTLSLASIYSNVNLAKLSSIEVGLGYATAETFDITIAPKKEN